tara:strand:+ start:1079 stop:1546 length:468 start_codon:yes stop_codon:yes gene_type:complete
LSWNNKITVKKGDIGEQIIKDYLERKGWVIYAPTTDKAHYFDMIATRNKKEIIGYDVKTKARLNKIAATGIDKQDYLDYMRFTRDYYFPFYLFFVDEKEGKVYYQLLKKLPEPFELTPEIVCWYLKDLQYIFSLTEDQKTKLSKFDNRNYKYKPQ